VLRSAGLFASIEKYDHKPYLFKKGGKYMLVESTYLRMLDIMNYYPPTRYASVRDYSSCYTRRISTLPSSMDGYIKSWAVENETAAKIEFPYYILSNLNLLSQPVDALQVRHFQSDLRAGGNVLSEPLYKWEMRKGELLVGMSEEDQLRILGPKPQNAEERLAVLKAEWSPKFKSLKELLLHYCQSDTTPLLKALLRQRFVHTFSTPYPLPHFTVSATSS
jgi:hypothetical protein